MFFREIEDFENNFKFLDRLNVLLFNLWKDANAEKYKSQSMEQLEMFYRNYINEMRQKSHEMSNILRQIDENMALLENVRHKLSDISQHPDIEGCELCRALGDISDVLVGTEEFIVTPDERRNDLESIARKRCHKLKTIKNVSTVRPL